MAAARSRLSLVWLRETLSAASAVTSDVRSGRGPRPGFGFHSHRAPRNTMGMGMDGGGQGKDGRGDWALWGDCGCVERVLVGGGGGWSVWKG